MEKIRRETASKANFWDQVANPVDFSRRAFMTKPLFHLNTGIDGKVKHQNLFFGPFLREGVATPGFAEVPPEIAQMVPNSAYEEIRDAINEETYDGQGMRSSCQVAMWLTDATVGSFVVMRHEFPECPFTPSRLKPNGKYIGPVFVIGVVTQKILPGSAHEKRIKKKQMGEYKRHNTHTFSLVDWKWMGMKATLQEETKRYINSVCQPTINRMCQDPRKEYKCAATGEAYTGFKEQRRLASKRRVFLHLPFHPNDPPSREIQSLWRRLVQRPRGKTALNRLRCRSGVLVPIDQLVIAYSRAPNLGNLFSYRKICQRSGPPVSSYLD